MTITDKYGNVRTVVRIQKIYISDQIDIKDIDFGQELIDNNQSLILPVGVPIVKTIALEKTQSVFTFLLDDGKEIHYPITLKLKNA